MEEIEKLQQEFEDCKKTAEEYLNGWKRAKADYINREREIEKEKTEWLMFSHAASISGLLPILDSLESASLMNKDISPIRDQAFEIFQKLGVEKIKSVGEPVNLELHEVVGKEKSDEAASGLIAKEVQAGYTLHGKVLRIAKVIISE